MKDNNWRIGDKFINHVCYVFTIKRHLGQNITRIVVGNDSGFESDLSVKELQANLDSGYWELIKEDSKEESKERLYTLEEMKKAFYNGLMNGRNNQDFNQLDFDLFLKTL